MALVVPKVATTLLIPTCVASALAIITLAPLQASVARSPLMELPAIVAWTKNVDIAGTVVIQLLLPLEQGLEVNVTERESFRSSIYKANRLLLRKAQQFHLMVQRLLCLLLILHNHILRRRPQRFRRQPLKLSHLLILQLT